MRLKRTSSRPPTWKTRTSVAQEGGSGPGCGNRISGNEEGRGLCDCAAEVPGDGRDRQPAAGELRSRESKGQVGMTALELWGGYECSVIRIKASIATRPSYRDT